MARLFIVIAAICWSTGGVFAKSIDLPGPVLACARALFAASCLVFFVPRHLIRFHRGIFQMAICFAIMNVSFITATTLTTAANAIVLQYTAPAWMVLGSVWWLKEPLDRRSLRSLVLSGIGIVIILSGTKASDLLGVSLALLSGVAYGGVALFLRKLRAESPAWLVFFNLAFSGVCLLPWVLSAYPTAIGTIDSQMLVGLFAFGSFQVALPYVLFSSGLREVSAQEAGLLALAELFLNPLLTYFALGEEPARATLIGGAFILIGVGLRYLPARKARPVPGPAGPVVG